MVEYASKVLSITHGKIHLYKTTIDNLGSKVKSYFWGSQVQTRIGPLFKKLMQEKPSPYSITVDAVIVRKSTLFLKGAKDERSIRSRWMCMLPPFTTSIFSIKLRRLCGDIGRYDIVAAPVCGGRNRKTTHQNCVFTARGNTTGT